MSTNKILIYQDTAITWKASLGDYAISCSGLAAGAGRCGVKADLGARFAEFYSVHLNCEFTSAPTAGGTVAVYWAPSVDNTVFPGGATGTDAAYKNAEEAEWAKQLYLIGVLVVTNDGDGTKQTQCVGVLAPPTRYGCPVIINNASVAFKTSETNNSLVLVPLKSEIQAAS